MSSPVRFLAQRIHDGKWLHTDLPLNEPSITWSRNASSSVSAVLNPENADLMDIGLQPWGSWIYAEMDGQIRNGGILQPSGVEGDSLKFETVGFTEYYNKVRYRRAWPWGTGLNIDPLAAARHLADYAQQDDRTLGIEIDQTTSPVRKGTPQTQVDPNSGPYRLVWWENTKVGEEFNKLATETPFEYREMYFWNSDKTNVRKRLALGYPKLGNRRTDLRFAEGENLTEIISVEEDPEIYASRVYVNGRGEGSDIIWAMASTEVPGVLPVMYVHEDKSITTADRARALASEILAKRSGALHTRYSIDSITLPANNEHAPLGSFDPGDEILIRANMAWAGEIALWHRVESITYTPDDELMKVSLSREGIQ